MLCDSTGRGLLETCTWFPLNFAPRTVPFADFALYPFVVINPNSESNSMLRPVRPPSESLNLNVALGTPIQQRVPEVLCSSGYFCKLMESTFASKYLLLLADDVLAPEEADIPDSADP